MDATTTTSHAGVASAGVSSSVAAALSEGLERLVAAAREETGLGRESLPLLETFLHATDLLIESAGTQSRSCLFYVKMISINLF